MGLKNCEIFFDNPWNTYYPGQTVNGHVDFTFDSTKKIRGIVIKFKGESNTSWTQTESVTNNEGKSEEQTVTFTGNEEYFQVQYYLLGGQSGGDIELPAGKHSYPFTCALPPTLPSSFEGEFGHVRYTVKVTLDRPWKFDQESKIAFTVVSPVDLNLNPKIKEPVKQEIEKTFCCWCCASGPLTLAVSVPMTGYVSGQVIPITVECDNASNVKVNVLRFILRKKLKYYSHNPRRETKESNVVISELSVGPVEGGSSHSSIQNVTIPPLPPSNLTNCGLIDLDYELKVETNVSGMHQNLDIKIPIVLGTIPLAQPPPNAPYGDVAPNQINPAVNGSGGIGWNPVIGPDGSAVQPNIPPHQSMYPNIPPPSFSQSAFGTTTIQDKNDNEHTNYAHGQPNFAPMYPVYSFNPSAPFAQQ